MAKASNKDENEIKESAEGTEKKKKGPLLFVIFVSLVVVIQVIVLWIGIQYIDKVQQASDLQIETEARASAIWRVDYDRLSETNQFIVNNVLSNRNRSIQTYWHSKDRDFRLTIEAEGLNTLLKNGYLWFGEGEDGEHLSLTVFYNPLRIKDPQLTDLTPVYQVVRYAKPEIVKIKEQQQKEYEAQLEELEKQQALEEENKSQSNKKKDDKEETEEILLEPPLEINYYYPFESEQILFENEDYMLFISLDEGVTEEVINANFLNLYLKPNSIRGDYGWENGVFYDKPTEEEGEEIAPTETPESETVVE